MRTDHEYLKRLLTAFQDAPGPTTDISELERAGFPRDDPRFEFHMTYLDREGLVESDLGGIGFDKSPDGAVVWSVIPLRLTARGHQLADSMTVKG
ncbi:MAG: hypothetical protein WA485_25075 [Candidatus Sulfotelmatobacter sp.]